jgi:ketosteroid isomerase-like protein
LNDIVFFYYITRPNNLGFLMNTKSFALLIVLFLTSAFHAQDKYTCRDQAAMVASERAFSAATTIMGITEGFLTFFSPSSISFESGLEKVYPKLLMRKKSSYPLKSTLTWWPESGDISKSGDLGVLFGPWLLKNPSADTIIARGRYISIWEKDTLGLWKVAFDCGIETNDKDTIPVKVVFTSLSDSGEYMSRKSDELQKAKEHLMRSEAVFAKLNGDKPPTAADSVLSDNVVLFRGAIIPLKGTAEAKEWYREIKSSSYRIAGIHVSPAGDMAYAYGTCGRNMDTLNYLHIWKTDASGVWKLVVDVCGKK